MSTWVPTPITCEKCGYGWPAPLLRGIHVTRLPEVRAAILDRTFQVFDCPLCGHSVHIENSTVYTDFARWHYLAVEPEEEPDRTAARHRQIEEYDGAFTWGPPPAQELGRNLRRRIVFGHPALREKLVLWDASADDRTVEAAKALTNDGAPPTPAWRVADVLPGGHLICWTGTGGVKTITRNVLDSVGGPERAARLYPWLDDEWLVDVTVGSSSR
jgi:hypothetical protein